MRLLGPTLVLVALTVGGCGPAEVPAGRPLAVTLTPVSTAGALPEPGFRYPLGTRLVRLDLDDPGRAGVSLSGGLAAAGGAAVSMDAETVAFVGRRTKDEPFAVWLNQTDGGEPRRLAGAPQGAGGVAWLPDGRLVVAAPVPGAAPLDEMNSAWALFVLEPEAETAQRITFGPGEVDPTVLADGRILFSQWQPGGDGRPEGGGFSLFTVHPDGTGAAPLHGFHDGARLKLGARQLADRDLVFAAGDQRSTSLRRVRWRDPLAPSLELEPAGLLAVAVEPAGAELLVAGVDDRGASVLRSLSGAGLVGAELPAPEGSAIAHAAAIAPGRRPQGHLSMVDRELAEGQLLCVDARPPGMSQARGVRLWAGIESGAREELGELALAEDGSFFARVPADRPLYLELLDDGGRVLMTTETPVWVRPKEVRACVGCHESPHTGPPNRRPQAVLGEPVDLTGGRES